MSNKTCNYPGCSLSAVIAKVAVDRPELKACSELGHQLWLRAFMRSELYRMNYTENWEPRAIESIRGTFDMATAVKAEREYLETQAAFKGQATRKEDHVFRQQLILALVQGNPSAIQATVPSIYVERLFETVDLIEAKLSLRS